MVYERFSTFRLTKTLKMFKKYPKVFKQEEKHRIRAPHKSIAFNSNVLLVKLPNIHIFSLEKKMSTPDKKPFWAPTLSSFTLF